MKKNRDSRSYLDFFPATFVFLAVMLVTAASPQPVPGGEPRWEDFLEGLKQRHYFDTAIEYLESLRDHPRCPDELSEVLDYEIGTVHIEALASGNPFLPRSQHLEKSRRAIREFLRESPEHPKAFSANVMLGKILVEEGNFALAKSEMESTLEEEALSLRKEARDYFEQAGGYFEAALELARTKSKELEDTPGPEKDLANARFLDMKIQLATLEKQIGKTFEKGSDEYRSRLRRTAETLHDIFVTYKKWTGSLNARFLEAETYYELGQMEKAREILLELNTLPQQPAFFDLKTDSLILMLKLALEGDLEDYTDGLERVAKWEDAIPLRLQNKPSGLHIHLMAAKLALARAKALGSDHRDHQRMRSEAHDHLDFIIRFRSPYRREASDLLAEHFKRGDTELETPEDYFQARDLADRHWGEFIAAATRQQDATDSQDKKETRRKLEFAAEDTVYYTELAIALRESDTPIEEINDLRLRLASLFWTLERYHDAAVLGEFLARRYADSPNASKAAEIALTAYRKLFLAARQARESTDSEMEHLASVAEYIATRWPRSPQAEQAWLMRIDSVIDRGNPQKAKALLERIPENSPERATAQLRLGQSLWSAYAKDAAKEEESRPSQQELDQMISTAKEALESGIAESLRRLEEGGSPDYLMVYSALSLAQLQLNTGNPSEAIRWLTQEQIGPLALIEKDSGITRKEEFQITAYITALRAYVGAQKLDRAEAIMDKLESLVRRGSGDSQKRLTEIYILLGKQLEERLTRLDNEGKKEEIQKVSQGFETFLQKISQREKGNTFHSLYWVAETFYRLGSGVDHSLGSTPPEAVRYYKQAASTYIKMLRKIKEDPDWAPENARNTLSLRLATCLSAMQQYMSAIKLLVSLLEENENRVDVQIQAARTYQDWGSESPEYYVKAILGGQERQGRHLIWGWNGIARRVQGREDYRDLYFEAIYHRILCRVQLAKSKSGEEQTKLLHQAETELKRIHRLYPNMGGPEWFVTFDNLLKNIRTFLGQSNPPGLKKSEESNLSFIPIRSEHRRS